jgi:hypothetical protein
MNARLRARRDRLRERPADERHIRLPYIEVERPRR